MKGGAVTERANRDNGAAEMTDVSDRRRAGLDGRRSKSGGHGVIVVAACMAAEVAIVMLFVFKVL